MRIGSIFVLALALFASLASAKETAVVLPQSIKRVRLVGVVTDQIKDSFNEKGELRGVTSSLNRSVTVSDFTAMNAQLNQLVSVLNSMEGGLGNQLLSSNLFSDMSTRMQVLLPAIEYGLTPEWSIGARMPVVKRSARNRFSVNSVNNAASILNYIGSINPALTAALLSVDGTSFDGAFFQKTLFTSKGYKAPADYEKTQIGDLEMGAKYNFHKDDTFMSTVLFGTRLPTGAQPAVDDLFDPGTSKGAVGVCIQGFQDVKIFNSLSLLASAKGIYNFPDTRERAVPRNAADALPSVLPQDGQVQQVRRVRGMELESELALTQKLSEAVELWGAYQFNAKAEDKFSGPGDLHYAGLSNNTATRLAAGEVGVQYSGIPAFRRGKLPVPFEVSLLYNRPLEGKNTMFNTFARMDLMVYF